MCQDEQYVNEIQHAPEIRIDRARLHHVVVIIHSIDLQEPGEPQHRVAAEIHLQQIERDQRQQIEDKGLGLDIMTGQFSAIVDHQTLLEVAGAKLHRHVQEEHHVGETVAGEPGGRRQRLQLRQTLTDDQRPEVVKDTGRQ